MPPSLTCLSSFSASASYSRRDRPTLTFVIAWFVPFIYLKSSNLMFILCSDLFVCGLRVKDKSGLNLISDFDLSYSFSSVDTSLLGSAYIFLANAKRSSCFFPECGIKINDLFFGLLKFSLSVIFLYSVILGLKVKVFLNSSSYFF